jgi:hypothetical protein
MKRGEDSFTTLFSARENVSRVDGTVVGDQVMEITILINESCTSASRTLSGTLIDSGTYTQTKASSATVSATIPLFEAGAPAGRRHRSFAFTALEAPVKGFSLTRTVTPAETVSVRSKGMLSTEVSVSGSLTSGAQDITAQLGTGVTGVKVVTRPSHH